MLSSEENRLLTSNIYNNIMDGGYVMIPILSSVLVFRKFSLSRLETGDRFWSPLRATEGRGGGEQNQYFLLTKFEMFLDCNLNAER